MSRGGAAWASLSCAAGIVASTATRSPICLFGLWLICLVAPGPGLLCLAAAGVRHCQLSHVQHRPTRDLLYSEESSVTKQVYYQFRESLSVARMAHGAGHHTRVERLHQQRRMSPWPAATRRMS